MDFVLLDECSGVKYILIKNNSRRRVVVECGAEYYNWKRCQSTLFALLLLFVAQKSSKIIFKIFLNNVSYVFL